jgi:hypothetical protein
MGIMSALAEYDAQAQRENNARHMEEDSDDEPGPRGRGGVQCQQQ